LCFWGDGGEGSNEAGRRRLACSTPLPLLLPLYYDYVVSFQLMIMLPSIVVVPNPFIFSLIELYCIPSLNTITLCG